MVGGTVIEIIQLSDKIWINCQEDNYKHKCAIYVVNSETSRKIKTGDMVWWQSGWALWTPEANRGDKRPEDAPKQKGGIDYDIRIPRIGFSGAHRPEV